MTQYTSWLFFNYFTTQTHFTVKATQYLYWRFLISLDPFCIVFEVDVEVNLRLMVNWSVCLLGVGLPSGAHDQVFVFSLMMMMMRHPLWWEDVSVIYLYNCFWTLPEQSLLGQTQAQLRTPPTWRARSPYLYPPGTGWPSYTPGHWVPFCHLLRLAGQQWRYSNLPPHWWHRFSSQSQVMTYGQSVSMSWCRPLWNLWTDIIFCLKVAVLSLWGALSDERSGLPPVSHYHQKVVHCQNVI
jgi:hypothetical protein